MVCVRFEGSISKCSKQLIDVERLSRIGRFPRAVRGVRRKTWRSPKRKKKKQHRRSPDWLHSPERPSPERYQLP